MDHKWFKTRLLDFQDSELPEQERRQILQHAEACPSCREQLEHWKGSRQALSHLLRVDPSEAFVGQVMARVEAIPVRQPAHWQRGLDRLTSWIPEWLYPEFGLTAAALFLFALTYFQQTPVSAEALLLNRLPQEDQWIGLSHASDWTGGWNAISSEDV